MTGQEVYLDYNATTPLAPEVLDAMLPYLRERYGNPSSIHSLGRPSREAVDASRDEVAAFLNASPREVVFTAGGTEADNLAILGFLAGLEAEGDERRHLVTSPTEHHAVLYPMQRLAKTGYDVSYVDVDEAGRVSPESLEKVLRHDTALVSVMYANNETGVIAPIPELARLAHDAGARFHTDAVQACGKIPVDVEKLGVDLLSLSGHKFYGPKGTGALYVRRGVPFKSIFRGGGQERSRRPGTENVPGIVGLARATRLASSTLERESRRLRDLRDGLEASILRGIDGSHVNGLGSERTPNTVSFRFDGVDGERLMKTLDRDGFAVSTGAACSSGSVEPSHVLLALGLGPEQVQGSIRVSLGRYTEQPHVGALKDAILRAVSSVRAGVGSAMGAGAS